MSRQDRLTAGGRWPGRGGRATQLKRFTKVLLQPGEATTVEFTLTIEDLLFYGLGDENVAKYETGWFRVRVGNQFARFELVEA